MKEAFEKVHRSELRGRTVKANRYVPAMAIQAPSDSIFFTGIPEVATDAELDTLFAGLENTRKIDVLRGSGWDAPYRGYGFARFKSVAAAIEGYKVMLTKTIRGSKVLCDFAKLTGQSLRQSNREKMQRPPTLVEATPEERKWRKGKVQGLTKESLRRHQKAEEGGESKRMRKVTPGKAGEEQGASRKANEIQDVRSEKATQEGEIQALRKEMTGQAGETQDVVEELAQEADEVEGVSEQTDQEMDELQALKTKMARQAEELQAMKEKMSDLESRGQQSTER